MTVLGGGRAQLQRGRGPEVLISVDQWGVVWITDDAVSHWMFAGEYEKLQVQPSYDELPLVERLGSDIDVRTSEPISRTDERPHIHSNLCTTEICPREAAEGIRLSCYLPSGHAGMHRANGASGREFRWKDDRSRPE